MVVLEADQAVVIKKKFFVLNQMFDENQKRAWAAAEALSFGRGGISLIAEITGMSRITIRNGIKEIKEAYENELEIKHDPNRIRAIGGGRKKATEKDALLLEDLKNILDSNTRGDPMSPLKWTCKSTNNIADELNKEGYRVSPETVRQILKEEGYSLQANKKTIEGKSHPDRDGQFQYINNLSKEFQASKDPVISIDTKKKENLGLLKNNGTEWREKGDPRKVKDHDFPDPELGKAIPYGVYDIANNDGFVSVGVDHDTAEFAVQTIRNWWYHTGKDAYPEARRVLITADCGGSNRPVAGLWRRELQKLADELKIEIHVSHFPPGTSKWNKIEHRMFSHISSNWRGQPLTSHEVVVNLIGATKTKTGLKIKSILDENKYETGKKVSKEELDKIRIERKDFHGDWNYAIKQRKGDTLALQD
jgi:transposase